MKTIAKYAVAINKHDNRFEAVIIIDGKKRVVIAGYEFNMGNREERRAAIDILIENLGRALREDAFPKDTLRYDHALTPTGTTVKLLGWPEDFARNKKGYK